MTDIFELENDHSKLQSQVARLEGRVRGLLEGMKSQAKSIQKLEDKQARLDGLRSQLS